MGKNKLIHLIYCSTAKFDFSEDDLILLLDKAREHNSGMNVTGMLLYTERSFFQVLEGNEDAVGEVFEKIRQDERHEQIISIINEPIAQRSFGEWTMGYTNITRREVGEIVGLNDFFIQASCFGQIDHGRAKKLLSAFKQGRWRARISNNSTSVSRDASVKQQASMTGHNVSFFYQPIVDANTASVISFEAMPRGRSNQPLEEMLKHINPGSRASFESFCHRSAIQIATGLGLQCNISLKLMALDMASTEEVIRTTLEAAEHNNVDPGRITLEVDQNKLKIDEMQFVEIINDYREAGLRIAISQFGEGHSGLKLIESYHPEALSFNEKLVRDIDSRGPRQAIVRGIAQACTELGIEIIAKYISTAEEYLWFRNEGVHFFQGDLFASPGLGQLPTANFPNKQS